MMQDDSSHLTLSTCNPPATWGILNQLEKVMDWHVLISMAKFTTNIDSKDDIIANGWPTKIYFIIGHAYFMATSLKNGIYVH